MQLLLDTHVLLWWLADNPRLKHEWRELLAAPDSRVCVSAASIWEIAVKSSLGKLHLNLPKGTLLSRLAVLCGFEDLPVRADHAAGVATLPRHHTDPFDRILIAQALVEGLTLVSADESIRRYDVPCM